jgi:putative ABC transport system substrate-binding protein
MIRLRRRRLLLASGALLAAASGARAQAPKLPVVAYVFGQRADAELTGPDPKHPHARAFVHRLRELGWEDGRNMTLERYGPENSAARAQEILSKLAARNVAVIYATSAAGGKVVGKMAAEATRTVPVVFSGGTDPVAMGLVASLARPGGNVTGLATGVGPEIAGKLPELLREIAPGVRKVAYFGTSLSRKSQEAMRQAVAAQLKLEVIVMEVDNAKQLGEAFERVASERADGLVVGSLGFLFSQAPRLVAFAAERRLPAVYHFPEAVDAGGLAAYGIDFLDLNRRGADYVDRILRGAKPAEMPVELPRKFEMVLNLKTARALGLSIPRSILLRADRVIE